MLDNIIVFIGPPLAGKNTLARLICKEFRSRVNKIISHIDFGFLLKKYATPDQLLKMNAGELLDNQVSLKILDQILAAQNADIILLDGCPRSLEQAQFLKSRTKIAIHLDLDLKTILSRVKQRIFCIQCGNTSIKSKIEEICECTAKEWSVRDDDTTEIATKRYMSYQKYSPDILNFYKSEDRLIDMLDNNLEILDLW